MDDRRFDAVAKNQQNTPFVSHEIPAAVSESLHRGGDRSKSPGGRRNDVIGWQSADRLVQPPHG